ncbi:hypothetical protein [Butyrivibrio sp. MC2013]|uniref:hypothetical protein n=1 Tax=Butyrivibrio sp. MC2013 TaxID=1280686 RepID=UPI0003FA9B71|nr:hypothetical protein [Butyrivibrio sp. MC2013]
MNRGKYSYYLKNENEIDLKDLFIHILLKWRFLFVLSIIGLILGAGLLRLGILEAPGGYDLEGMLTASDKTRIDSLYVQSAIDARTAIDETADRIDAIKDYRSHSIYASLDPGKVFSMSVKLAIYGDENTSPNSLMLIQSEYLTYIESGEYMEEAAAALLVSTGDVAELIQVSSDFYNEDRYVFEDGSYHSNDAASISLHRGDAITGSMSGGAAIVTVRIIGPDENTVNIIAEHLTDAISQYSDTVRSAIGDHKLDISNGKVIATADSLVRETLSITDNEIIELEKTVSELRKTYDTVSRDLSAGSLDDLSFIRDKLAAYENGSVSDKELARALLYLRDKKAASAKGAAVDYSLYEGEGKDSIGLRAYLIMSLAFMFALLFMGIIYIAATYVMSPYFTCEKVFAGRSVGIRILGKLDRGSDLDAKGIDKLLIAKRGDITGLSGDDNLDYIAENIKAGLKKRPDIGNNKLVISGMADENSISELISKLADKLSGYEIIHGENMAGSPAAIAAISDCRAVILVEGRDKSSFKDIDKELRIIRDLEADLIGVILV